MTKKCLDVCSNCLFLIRNIFYKSKKPHPKNVKLIDNIGFIKNVRNNIYSRSYQSLGQYFKKSTTENCVSKVDVNLTSPLKKGETLSLKTPRALLYFELLDCAKKWALSL